MKIKKEEIIIDINTLLMDFYYYNLNTKFKNKWELCKIISYKKYKNLNISCNDIRTMKCSKILNGGWHLSFFGSLNFIKNKINNFSHQEYNNNEFTDFIKNRKKNKRK